MFQKLFTFFLILCSLGLKGQSFYNTTPNGWVNIGDLDVSGDQLTLEAIITMTGPSINIVSKHTDPSNVNYLFRPGSFEITTTSGFANFSGIAAAGVILNLNECYHLAATYDGQMLRYYVNGCLTGSMPWTGNMIQNNFLTSIGNQSSCQCEAFNGYIDEVRIWNVARTQAQIQANMNDLPSPGTQTGLLGYYKFDGNYQNLQGNTTFDGIPLNGAALQNNLTCNDPGILSSNVSGTDAYCFGTNSGSIQVNASGGYTPYTYSIDGVNYQSSSLFTNVAAGNYTVYTASNPNCIVTQNITLTQPTEILLNTSTQDVNCFGQSNGSASVTVQGGTPPYTYEWNTIPPQTTSSINNLSAGNYQLTVTDNSCQPSGTELVVNGDFSQGNTGFTSNYVYCNTSNCIGEGMYAIGSTANFYHNAFTGIDHTSGTGNFMIINGSSSINNIWCQTVNVTPNTDYNFSCWVSTMVAVNPAELQFSINGIPVGNIFNAPPNVNQWDQFYTSWNSGSNLTATICITNINLQLSGNDFAIDDISFTPCVKNCFKTETVIINEPPELSLLITASQNPICAGETVTISATVSGGTIPYSYQWSNGSISTSITVSPSITTTYSLMITDLNGCTIVDSIEIIVNPLPTVNLGPDINICSNTSVLLDAGAGFSIYSWNNGANTQTISVLTSGTYSVTVTDQNNCEGSDLVEVNIYPIPVLYLGNDTSFCAGNTLTLNSGAGFSIYEWNTGTNLQTETISASGQYWVRIVDANNCENSDTIFVTVNPLPVFTLGNDTSFCFGNTLTLDPGPFVSYDWNNGSIQQTLTTGTSGTYFVIVTDVNGCQEYDEINITVNQLPQPFLGADTALCAGEIHTLNPGNYTDYLWQDGSSASYFTVTSAGTFSVDVTDNNNCTAYDEIVITYNQLPVVTITGPSSFCQGGQVILDAGPGAVSYLWNTGAITQTITTLSGGNFSVTVEDNNGCKASDNFQLTEFLLPVVNLGPDTSLCSNSPFTLDAGSGQFSYFWVTNESSRIININASGSYWVEVTNSDGCTNRDTIKVDIFPEPIVNYTASELAACAPATIYFRDNSTISSGTINQWLWTFGDGNYSILQNPSYLFSKPGSYTISLTTTTSDNCRAVKTITSFIDIHPAPVADFSNTPSETTILNPIIDFYNTSTGGDSYKWNFGDGTFSNETDPVKIFGDTGTFEIKLHSYNLYGCVDSAFSVIRIKSEFLIYFPSAFTPNRDGKNDVFYGYGYGILEYEFRIYNRWGEMIFKSNDLNTGWDGDQAPEDVYVYECSVRSVENRLYTLRGHVTLLR